jgi:hypothetical protein
MDPGTARKTELPSSPQSQGRIPPLPSPSDEHVIEVDAEVVCVNVWATRDGGELSDRILGRPVSEVVGEEIYRSLEPVFRRVMETGQSEAFEHALPDGSRSAGSGSAWFRFCAPMAAAKD